MRVRQGYARTDVNDESAFKLELAVVEFWCALYHVGMSSSAYSIVSNVKAMNEPLWADVFDFSLLY